MKRAAMPVHHLEHGCNEPKYRTNVPRVPAGVFAGPLVEPMRPLTPAQALAFVRSQAARCGLNDDEHDLRATARAVEAVARAAHDLRGRLRSLEANPLLVGPTGAVAVDALAEVGTPG